MTPEERELLLSIASAVARLCDDAGRVEHEIRELMSKVEHQERNR